MHDANKLGLKIRILTQLAHKKRNLDFLRKIAPKCI